MLASLSLVFLGLHALGMAMLQSGLCSVKATQFLTALVKAELDINLWVSDSGYIPQRSQPNIPFR